MTDPAILTYLPDPFAVGEAAFWLRRGCEAGQRVDAADVAAFEGPLLTYELPALLDELRRLGHSAPARPIDIGEALRLLTGLPKDDGGERLWDVWRNLAPHFGDRKAATKLEVAFKSREHKPVEPALSAMLAQAASALRKLWTATEYKLQENGEAVRFREIEVPVQAIFAHRHVTGLAIDGVGAAAELLDQVTDEKYAAYLKVAEMLEANPTGLNFWNIGPWLVKTDLSDLSNTADGGRLRDSFRIAAHRSSFAREFLHLIEAGQDEVILRRAAGIDQRIHPTFAVFGTVSGRILVSDPFLQQLRRRYRAIIAPDAGKRLIYLDYAQFEPGILAFLSEDPSLRASYRQGDLYEALSVRVFGNAEQRPLAKRMFLAFCYGMLPESIAKLVVGDSNDRAERQAAVESFFAAFPGLKAYRARMETSLIDKGHVASLVGNHRFRAGDGPLSQKERRWAANHPVQSSAALIFKEALVDLSHTFGKDAVLLPVHDAALLQFDDNDQFGTRVDEAREIMLRAFERRCPNIGPRVTAGAFAD